MLKNVHCEAFWYSRNAFLATDIHVGLRENYYFLLLLLLTISISVDHVFLSFKKEMRRNILVMLTLTALVLDLAWFKKKTKLN